MPFRKPSQRLVPTLVATLCLLAATGCGRSDNPDASAAGNASAATNAPTETYFPVGLGGHTLQLQLALTDSESARGLMFRDSLPEDHGMVFLFDTPGPQAFWMQNTRIPLDLAYFDASGRLLEVRKLFPHDTSRVRSASARVALAVETNRGWFRRHNVTPGARIDLDALGRAIRARGFPPDAFAPDF